MAETKDSGRGTKMPPGTDHLGSVAGGERSRVLLLECRIERLEEATLQARGEADRVREKLAASTAREAELAARFGELQRDLAEALAEILGLHRKLDRSEALRSEMEGHLLRTESGPGMGEPARLRRDLAVNEERIAVKDRSIEILRRRLDEVSASREILFTRIAEWHRLVSDQGPEAVDLAEFISHLRAEILSLENERSAADERERQLRESLAEAVARETESVAVEAPLSVAAEPVWQPAPGPDPEIDSLRSEIAVEWQGPVERLVELRRSEPVRACEPGEGVSTILESLSSEVVGGSPKASLGAARRLLALDRAAAAGPIAEAVAGAFDPSLRASMLVLLGKTGDFRAIGAIRPWIGADQAIVRSAAYEAACSLLDERGEGAASYLRAGLADSDPTVRRRCILSVATSRSLSCRPLLEPLRDDPDPKVRSLIRRVLSNLPPSVEGEGEDVVLALTLASTRAV